MKLSEYSDEQVIKVAGQQVYVKFLKYVIEYEIGHKPDWNKVEVTDKGWTINE